MGGIRGLEIKAGGGAKYGHSEAATFSFTGLGMNSSVEFLKHSLHPELLIN